MLTIKNLTYRIAGRTLLENTDLSVPKGHKVGLVGPNGAGKTTLFKLISQEIEADSGSIDTIKGARIGIVRQEMPDIEQSLIQSVIDSDEERLDLFKQAETETDPDKIAYIYDRLEAIDAYAAEARASVILAGLGFDEAAQQRKISEYSGGWRMRVALAAVLFQNPDILLLDEPTNHLDFETVIWLENFLNQYQGTFLLISHDRHFLNKTINHVVHLENQELTLYKGSYDTFETLRAQQRMNQQALFEKQQAHKDHLMNFVKRFGAKATKAKQAQSRLKAIERMDMVDAVISERAIGFKFPEPDDLGTPIFTLEKAKIGYGDKVILNNVDVSIGTGDRIALLGENGNGKSTLIKVIADKLALLGGDKQTHGKLRIGYFAQHQTDELDITQTPYEALMAVMKADKEAQCRALLGRFGFNKEKSDTQIGKLSGGEKARLLFCLMSFHAPHIMLLDEPTNHLDIESRAALTNALNNYTGTVILVSHDPYLIEAVSDQIWLIRAGQVKPFSEDLEGYRALVKEDKRAQNRKSKSKKQAEKTANIKIEEPKKKPNMKKIEADLEKYSKERDLIEAKMLEPEIMADMDKMAKLSTKHEKILEKLSLIEEEYLIALE